MEEVDIGRDFNKKTILVVDDEESIVDLLVYHLQKEGYDTLQAYDGVTAVDMAMKEKPDLILLDVMLPKMDGISACKRIRYSLNFSHKKKYLCGIGLIITIAYSPRIIFLGSFSNILFFPSIIYSIFTIFMGK